MSGFGADFHWVNDGLFPTASQLGIEVVSLAQSKRHQSRSRGCTASLMVRTPWARLMTPAVTKSQ